MKRFLKLIFGINIGVALLSTMSYLSPYIDPIKSWFFSAVGVFNPFYVLLHLFFIILWVVLRKKYAFLSLAIILIGWTHITGIYSFMVTHDNQDGISIMSFNFQNSSFINVKDEVLKEQRVREYESFLKDYSEIEVLCAYEMDFKTQQIISRIYGFEHKATYNQKSLAIFSKYPVIDKGLIDFGNRSNSCLWADLAIEKDTIRIYAVHFESNQVSLETEKVLVGEDFEQRTTWQSIKNILGKYGHHSVNRSHQVKELIKHKSKSPHPVIVCGDFNETPQSHLYYLLCKDMNDSFREKGIVYGGTYAGSIPGLRIDYILADVELEVSHHEVVRENYSDHYPVIIVIKIINN